MRLLVRLSNRSSLRVVWALGENEKNSKVKRSTNMNAERYRCRRRSRKTWRELRLEMLNRDNAKDRMVWKPTIR